MIPTLRDALSKVVKTSLNLQSDGIVRVDVPRSWPVGDALAAALSRDFMLGILAPFSADQFAACRPRVIDDDPVTITRWRNDTHRTDPMIVAGRATGRNEAGLASLGVVILGRDVIDEWEDALTAWLGNQPDLSVGLRPRLALVAALLGQARSGLTSAVELDSYFQEVLLAPLERSGRDLWRLGLVPDDSLLDSNHRVGKRLTENRDVIELVQQPSDTDQPKLRRLARSQEAKVAALVRYAATGDLDALKRAELAAVLSALSPGKKPPKRRPLDLLDFLSMDPSDASPDLKLRVLSELDQLVDLTDADGDDDSELLVSPEDFDDQIRLRVRRRHRAESSWTAESELSAAELRLQQVVAKVVTGDSATTTPLTGERVQRIMNDTAAQLAPLLEEYLESRTELVRLVGVFANPDEDLLALLLADTELRGATERYLSAWTDLLDEGGRLDPEQFKYPRQLLALLDGAWIAKGEPSELSGPYSRAELAPIHAWRLAPIVRLSAEMLQRLPADPNAIPAGLWALDRAIPAFNVLGSTASSLIFEGTDLGSLQFSAQPETALPPASSSDTGLTRMLAAYKKAYPWTNTGSTITVVDPPSGAMVPKFLRSVDRIFDISPGLRQVRCMDVHGVQLTDGYPATLSTGHYASLERWLSTRPPNSNVAIRFVPVLPGRTARGSLGVGVHTVLHVALEPGMGPDPFEPRYTPRVTLSPARDNHAVRLLEALAEPGRSPSVAEYDLSLPDEELRRLSTLAARADWLAVGIPGSISALELTLSDGEEAPRVARFEAGPYTFFVVASSLYALQRAVLERVKEMPLAGTNSAIEARLADLAQHQPQRLFDLALNRHGVVEALGLMVARSVARRSSHQDWLVLEVSLDDANWANAWLPLTGQRADFLLVHISPDEGQPQPIEIQVVESKATQRTLANPDAADTPYAEASEQVRATRQAVIDLLRDRGDSLVENLRFRALCEHLVGLAAGSPDLRPFRPSHRGYFENLSRLGEDPGVASSVPVAGLVVATFLGSQGTARSARESEVELVAATATTLEQLLAGAPIEVTSGPSVARSDDSTPQWNLPEASPAARDAESTPTSASEPTSHPAQHDDHGGTTRPPSEVLHLAARVVDALRLRHEGVGVLDESMLEVGPTFVSVPLPLDAGSSVAPLQRSEDDIARDSGVASVEIDNDPARRGHVRILFPRRERFFPSLPPLLSAPESAGGNDYLRIALGQDVRGRDQSSFISRWPHALVAGSTQSGKTTFLRSLLRQVGNYGPATARIALVDGKGETDYFGVVAPECFVDDFPEPLLDPSAATDVLEWLFEHEIPHRRGLARARATELGSRFDAREDYLAALRSGSDPTLTPIVVVIDEFNEIMLRGRTERDRFLRAVQSVVQTGRSVLIHLILSTQRPSREVVPQAIKANLPTRIALRLPTAADSITVLGRGGAERLLGYGDLLFVPVDDVGLRLQGYSA